MFEKFFFVFSAFKKVQAHIPLVFLVFIGENFGVQLGTNFLHAQFEGQNFGMVWRFKFNTLLIMLTVKRQSDLTRSLTLVTFSSVFDVQGLPERGSYFTLSQPSKNALCHLKTCVLNRASSP